MLLIAIEKSIKKGPEISGPFFYRHSIYSIIQINYPPMIGIAN
jgi:hypothetical protein